MKMFSITRALAFVERVTVNPQVSAEFDPLGMHSRRCDVVTYRQQAYCVYAGLTEEQRVDSMPVRITIPTNIHTANRIFTNIMLMADKHNIPKGKMYCNCRLLPEDIVCIITQRNNIRRANDASQRPSRCGSFCAYIT